MNKDDLLFEYFEGDLGERHEDELFEMLHFDEDAREDFNQQLKMLLMTRQESYRKTAPLESTEAIFSSIGINSGIYHSAKRKKAFWNFVSKPSFRNLALISAIFLFLFFSSFMLYDYVKNNYFNDGFGTSISNNASSGSGAKVNSNLNYPIVSSSEINTNSSNLKEIPNQGQRNSTPDNSNNSASYFGNASGSAIFVNSLESQIRNEYSSKFNSLKSLYQQRENKLLAVIKSLKDANNSKNLASSNQNNNNSENSNQNLSENNPTIFREIQNQNYSNSESKNLSNLRDFRNNLNSNQSNILKNNLLQNNSINSQSLMSDLLPKDYRYVVSLKSFNQQYATQVQSTNSNNSTQFEFDLAYKFNQSNQLGIVVGRGIFPQSFNITSADGKKYLQVQIPELYYYGLSYKFTPEFLLNQNFVLPYLYGFGSGTTVGPYFNLASGLEFNIFSRLSLTAGVSASSLIYNVENVIYSTNKINFVYGVNVKF